MLIAIENEGTLIAHPEAISTSWPARFREWPKAGHPLVTPVDALHVLRGPRRWLLVTRAMHDGDLSSVWLLASYEAEETARERGQHVHSWLHFAHQRDERLEYLDLPVVVPGSLEIRRASLPYLKRKVFA